VPASPERGHNETILAVEDNVGLRAVLVRQLTTAGYRVLEAENARVALDIVESELAIDLLLTDIVMPGGMNGHELARRASGLRPKLKILLTSGFSDRTTGDVSVALTTPMLRKPYRREALLRTVHETLKG
jgi:CheY-like chemotaxis protein